MITLPDVGLSRAPIMLSRVDLPLPEGPTIETNSPFLMERFSPLRATTLPAADSNTLTMFSTLRTIESSLPLFKFLPAKHSIEIGVCLISITDLSVSFALLRFWVNNKYATTSVGNCAC